MDALLLLEVLEVVLDVCLVARALLGGCVVRAGVSAVLRGLLGAGMRPRLRLRLLCLPLKRLQLLGLRDRCRLLGLE